MQLNEKTELRKVVTEARAASMSRLNKTAWRSNAQVAGSFLRRELRLPRQLTAQLDYALDRNLISMRGYDRCLRVAWSLADLAGRTIPAKEDIATAVYLRGSEL